MSVEYGDVTVVIPTISGREDLLARARRSVEAQTLPPHEVIIVADRDGKGAWWARNAGAARVTTTWLAWLDDDDELGERHLEVLLAAAERSGVDLVYSCMEVVGTMPDGRPARNPLAVAHQGRWVLPCGIPFGPEQEHHLRFAGNFIPVTYLVRAELVRKVGGMPPSGGPKKEEDYQLLLRLLDAGARFLHVPEVTWRYHIHDRNTGGGWPGTGASNKEAFRE
jgi:glycosyltransferase involved in cell wall biosynthesis